MQEMKLHFQRYEFKYLLSWQTFQEIRARLQRYVKVDGFAQKAAGNYYEVISLYYDSPKFYYYYEKFDGVKNRKKIRLRTYRMNNEFVGNAFLEIKRKCDAVILKDRFLLDKNAYHNFIKNNEFFMPDGERPKTAAPIIEEYEQERARHSLQPQILINYRREPYVGKFNNNFRVTFDYNLMACPSGDLYDTDCATPLLPDGVVMELKFNGKFPYYIREVIESYNLERVAFSKYGRGVEACHLLPDLNLSRHHFFNVDKNLLADY